MLTPTTSFLFVGDNTIPWRISEPVGNQPTSAKRFASLCIRNFRHKVKNSDANKERKIIDIALPSSTII